MHQAEKLVIRQMLLLQADLSAGKIRPDCSKWIDAVWLLAITLPRFPPIVADQARPFLNYWYQHAISAGRPDWVQEQMLRVAYNHRHPIVNKCAKGQLEANLKATDPQDNIQLLANKIGDLDRVIQSMKTAPCRTYNHKPCIRAASGVVKQTQRRKPKVTEKPR